MTRIVLDIDPEHLASRLGDEDYAVQLYATSTEISDAGVIGADFLDKFERLSTPPVAQTVDLVSVALAVTAADTFMYREDEPDGWTRTIEVDLCVHEPDRWNALAASLARLLGFLSGDIWSFHFRGGGHRPPSPLDVRARSKAVDLSSINCIALFSGGLDSALGVHDLIDAGKRPLLVSHAPRGDKSFQDAVAALLPAHIQRFSFNSYPTWPYATEITTRTRSFLFLAAAAMAAEALAGFRNTTIDLNICENGLIALNPPLTQRRIGALSTRTAHPHYLAQLQDLFDALGLRVRIVNPHRHETKGEMLARRSTQNGIEHFAAATVSCGNWKRKNKQCGRCWPCVIRRSAFMRAGIADVTEYDTIKLQDALVSEDERDDVIAIHSALKRRYERDIRAWTLEVGPLPLGPERAAYFGVVERGMGELEAFLHGHGLKT